MLLAANFVAAAACLSSMLSCVVCDRIVSYRIHLQKQRSSRRDVRGDRPSSMTEHKGARQPVTGGPPAGVVQLYSQAV